MRQRVEVSARMCRGWTTNSRSSLSRSLPLSSRSPSSPGTISICPSESQTMSQLPRARVRQRWRTRASPGSTRISRASGKNKVGKSARTYVAHLVPTASFTVAQKYTARLQHYLVMLRGSVKTTKRRLMLIQGTLKSTGKQPRAGFCGPNLT